MQCNQAILHVWDHPRLCGEKASCSSQKQQTIGSPPPMRGKDGAITVVWEYFRITPAYAGKRQACPHTCGSRWDHPRLCGEKLWRRWTRHLTAGSPPPMRGKAVADTYHPHYHGITPAYAGKSIFSLCSYAFHKDHPRLCGEKTKKIPKQRYFFHQPASFSFSLQYT